jgi:hypothetical protein
MAYHEEKGKSREDLLRIKEFLIYLSHRSSVLLRGCIGWVGEVQIVKIYPQRKVPSVTGHIWIADWIPEAFAGHD